MSSNDEYNKRMLSGEKGASGGHRDHLIMSPFERKIATY